VFCGEGGALVVNDPALIARAEILREKGTDRSRFFRGEVDRYTWVDVGSSYLMSDLLAAFLLGQLETRASGQARRQLLWQRYVGALQAWAESRGILLPTVPGECTQAYHLLYLQLPDLSAREGLIAHLRARGIQAVFHYLPLHLSSVGVRYGGRVGDCPVTEWASDRLLRLPFHTGLSDHEQDLVISALLEF
jgi:dTDP-4-amino-4,6-dideoxygalactose transaminase